MACKQIEILGNQDGGRTIIRKSRKRPKLEEMKSIDLKVGGGSKEQASKGNVAHKWGILANEDGGRR